MVCAKTSENFEKWFTKIWSPKNNNFQEIRKTFLCKKRKLNSLPPLPDAKSSPKPSSPSNECTLLTITRNNVTVAVKVTKDPAIISIFVWLIFSYRIKTIFCIYLLLKMFFFLFGERNICHIIYLMFIAIFKELAMIPGWQSKHPEKECYLFNTEFKRGSRGAARAAKSLRWSV